VFRQGGPFAAYEFFISIALYYFGCQCVDTAGGVLRINYTAVKVNISAFYFT